MRNRELPVMPTEENDVDVETYERYGEAAKVEHSRLVFVFRKISPEHCTCV